MEGAAVEYAVLAFSGWAPDLKGWFDLRRLGLNHMFDARTASAWVSFFSAVPRKTQFARLQALFYRLLESNLGSSVDGILSPAERRQLILGMSVLIDGMALAQPKRRCPHAERRGHIDPAPCRALARA